MLKQIRNRNLKANVCTWRFNVFKCDEIVLRWPLRSRQSKTYLCLFWHVNYYNHSKRRLEIKWDASFKQSIPFFSQKYHNCGSSGMEKLLNHIARFATDVATCQTRKRPQGPQYTHAVIHSDPSWSLRKIYGVDFSRTGWGLGWCFCSEVWSRVPLLARYWRYCQSKTWLLICKLQVSVGLRSFRLRPGPSCSKHG